MSRPKRWHTPGTREDAAGPRGAWYAAYRRARGAYTHYRTTTKRKPGSPLPRYVSKAADECHGYRFDADTPDSLHCHRYNYGRYRNPCTPALTHRLRMYELRNHPKLP